MNQQVRIRNASWGQDLKLKSDLTLYVEKNLRRRNILDIVTKNYPQYSWSISSLDSRLKYFGIKYTDYGIDLDIVKRLVKEELNSPGPFLRYRAVHRKLREVHHLNVPRSLVYDIMVEHVAGSDLWKNKRVKMELPKRYNRKKFVSQPQLKLAPKMDTSVTSLISLLTERKTETSPIGGHSSQNKTIIADTPYYCKICEKYFSAERYLKRHMDNGSHTRQKRYECGICGKEFSQTNNLQSHIKIHYYCTFKPFKVSPCGKSFVDENNLQKRIQSHTSEKLDYECHICGMTFSMAYILQNHLKNHYNYPDKRFQRSIQGESSVDISMLKRHIVALTKNVQKSQSKEKLFECGVCGKIFARAYGLQRHIKIHYNYPDKPVGRSKWGKCIFVDASKTIHSHVNTVLKQPFTCDVCGKAYISKQCLQTHELAEHNLWKVI